MKKNSLIYTIIPFLSILLFSSCDLLTNTPKEPTLPAITTVGAGTFGCMVNGELYLPRGRALRQFAPNPDASFTEISGTLRLTVGNNIDQQTYIHIVTGSIYNKGIYGYLNKHRGYSYSSLGGCAEYLHFDDPTDTLEILFLDIENDIISGTFNFTLINRCDSSDTIRVTDGRFDLEYTL